MPTYHIIDSDAHAIEPKNLWEKWLPGKFTPLEIRSCKNRGRMPVAA